MGEREQNEKSFRSQVANLLVSRGDPIVKQWRLLFASPTLKIPAKKIDIFEQAIQEGTDLFSFLLRMLNAPNNEPVDIIPLLERVNRIDYDIRDLNIEVRTFKESVVSLLLGIEELSAKNLFEQYLTVANQIDRLFELVLSETSVIYERVIESGARGFIRVNRDNRITYANMEMRDMAEEERLRGKDILEYFERDDLAFVSKWLQAEPFEESPQRHLRWKKTNGNYVDVNAEVVPLTSGGYLNLNDIGFFRDTYTKVFDKHPLAIVEYGTDFIATYSNQAANDLMGVETCVGYAFTEFVADHAAMTKVEEEKELRRSGLTGDYTVRVCRPKDKKTFEVRVVSVARRDRAGEYAGAFVILEPLTLGSVIDKMYDAIAEENCNDSMFKRIHSAANELFKADELYVSVLSSDGQHSRVLYDTNVGGSLSTRWFPLSPAMQKWNQEAKVVPIDDLTEFLQKYDQKLLEDADVQHILQSELYSWLRFPIYDENGHVHGSVAFAAKGHSRFSHQDVLAIEKLPLDRAFEQAWRRVLRRERQLESDLTERVLGSKNQEEIAEHLTSLLVEVYGWQNVAYFVADRSIGKFRLIAQAYPKKEGKRLPKDYSQNLSDGVMGEVYKTGQAISICDIENDEKYRNIYLVLDEDTRSELCVPVKSDGVIFGLLNLEHTQVNAFSQDDLVLLEKLATTTVSVLQKLRWGHRLEAAYSSVQDPMFFVDEFEKVCEPNYAAKRVLSIDTGDAIDSLYKNFEDPDEIRERLQSAGDCSYTGNLKPVQNQRRRLMSVTKKKMPGQFPGYLIALTDVTNAARKVELDEIPKRFVALARDVKTPITLISSWLTKLHESIQSEQARETLEAIQFQLIELDIGYDKLLYAENVLASSGNAVAVRADRLIDCVLSEFPEGLKKEISISIEHDLPPWNGHFSALALTVKSLIALLLRCLDDDGSIQISIFRNVSATPQRTQEELSETQVCIELAGSDSCCDTIEFEEWQREWQHEDKGNEYWDAVQGLSVSVVEKMHGGRFSTFAKDDSAYRFLLELPMEAVSGNGMSTAGQEVAHATH